jgi:hypothetical protein
MDVNTDVKGVSHARIRRLIKRRNHFRVLSAAFLVGWMYRGLKQLRLLTVRPIRLFFADGDRFLERWLRRLGLKDC